MAVAKLFAAWASSTIFAGFIFVYHAANFSAFDGREASLQQGLEDCPAPYWNSENCYDL